MTSGLAPGILATYRGTLETRVEWTGLAAAMLFDRDSAEGAVVLELEGRQRLLALPAGEATEIVEDFRAESGSVTVDADGDHVVTDLTRDELLDAKPITPPVLVDQMLKLVSNERSRAPGAFSVPVDRIAGSALVGPPLTATAVDVGDSWTTDYEDPLLGSVTIDAAIIGEERAPDGSFWFVIEFGGQATDVPQEVDLGAGVELTSGLGVGGGFDTLLPEGSQGSVIIRSAEMNGEMRFDPARGVAVRFESLQAFAVDFDLEIGGQAAVFSLEAGSFRNLELRDVGLATPFELESVLDRFEVGPSALAASAFAGLTGYDLLDVTDEEADVAFEPLQDLRQDLFAGASIVKALDDPGDSAIVLAVTTGGEFRGAPFVAEEVATFISGTRPRSVSIGDRTAHRVEVGDEESLVYGNETHLFIVIGPRELSERILTDLTASIAPYLWQPGDCLDFRDNFDNATPYAPFGVFGARHCLIDHVYEVIHSEVLTEGGNARFPSDLSDRSEAACGRAFFDFTGTTELESAVSMIRYLPDREEWDQGSRYLACVVFVGGSEGEIIVDGPIDGFDPALAFSLEAGTCLFALFPVSCEDPHNREIIAAFELPDGPDAPMPDSGDLLDLIRGQCEAAFAEFVLGSGPGIVEVFEISDVFGAWEFGARRYYCMASVVGDSGFRLDVTGTFGTSWDEVEERVSA